MIYDCLIIDDETLLAYLIHHAGRVISKQELFEKVWEDKFTGGGTLNVHIRKLREAIEREPGNPEYIFVILMAIILQGCICAG